MGLLDVLNGMRNGPRGAPVPNATESTGGGMSPITMAILALLAYKGLKHFRGSPAQPAPGPSPSRVPSGGTVQAGLPGGAAGAGGLGDLLKGGLGGLLAGGAAGSVLSGGLGSLIDQFQRSGHGETAGSWVGHGPNKDISTSDLAKSIGSEDLDEIAGHVGLSREQLIAALKQELPGAIDELTPDGRIPTGDELSRRF